MNDLDLLMGDEDGLSHPGPQPNAEDAASESLKDKSEDPLASCHSQEVSPASSRLQLNLAYLVASFHPHKEMRNHLSD